MHISWRGIASFYIADRRTKWMDVPRTVIAASHNYSPRQEARVCARERISRTAKCNKCTRESNKRQTPMTNRQTISVRSATSGGLFVIKDGTTINPVERIYQTVRQSLLPLHRTRRVWWAETISRFMCPITIFLPVFFSRISPRGTVTIENFPGVWNGTGFVITEEVCAVTLG